MGDLNVIRSVMLRSLGGDGRLVWDSGLRFQDHTVSRNAETLSCWIHRWAHVTYHKSVFDIASYSVMWSQRYRTCDQLNMLLWMMCDDRSWESLKRPKSAKALAFWNRARVCFHITFCEGPPEVEVIREAPV
jgi:hypothetical protein